jgi:hypothetical protein
MLREKGNKLAIICGEKWGKILGEFLGKIYATLQSILRKNPGKIQPKKGEKSPDKRIWSALNFETKNQNFLSKNEKFFI